MSRDILDCKGLHADQVWAIAAWPDSRATAAAAAIPRPEMTMVFCDGYVRKVIMYKKKGIWE